MGVIWTGRARPNMAGMPAGARAQQRGDGSWVVVYDGPAAAPAMGPGAGSPSTRFDTRGEVNDVNPGVALPGTAAGNARIMAGLPPAGPAAGSGGGGDPGAAAPSAPAFNPLEEPIYGPRLQGILSQQRGLPGVFNPQRQRLAEQTAQGIVQAGLRENASTEEASRTVGKDSTGADLQPDVTYRYVLGPEGRVYRQAFMQVATGYNGRGAYYSTGQQRSQTQARAGLQAREAQTQTSFDNQQSGLTQQESQQAAGFGDQYQSTLSDQGRYRAQQAANAVDPQQTGQQAAANAGVGPQAGGPVKPITVDTGVDTSPLPGVQPSMPRDRRSIGGPQPAAAAPGPLKPRKPTGPAYVDWRRLGVKPGTRR